MVAYVIQSSLALGGRRRENLSREEKVAFMASFIEKAAAGGILIVSESSKHWMPA
jgi:hypothetical protein